MQLNPLNIAQTELVYRIQAEDESLAQRLGTVYENIVDSVGLYDWAEQQTGIDAAYAAELISVNTKLEIFEKKDVQNVGIGNDSLKVTGSSRRMKRPADSWQLQLSSYIEQQQNLAKELGNHELVLLSETSGKTISTDVMDRQIDYGDQVSDLRARIASAKAGFTADQQQYYDLLTWEEETKEDEVDQEDTTTEVQPVLASPSVSKKYVLLGAVLFAFVYTGILFLAYIFNSKIVYPMNYRVYTTSLRLVWW